MCNSLYLQFQPSSNSICGNNKITPRYSIGKIFPRETPKEKPLSLKNISPKSSIGNTFHRPPIEDIETFIIEKDESAEQQEQPIPTIAERRKGQDLVHSNLPFLLKLHILLDDVEATGNDHIVSWLEHGRAFKVYRPKSFISMIVPYYFKQSKIKSFQRQLHLYEFSRTQYGPEAGSYSHPLFLRGKPDLCLPLGPIKIKGKAGRQASSMKRKELECQKSMIDATPDKAARMTSAVLSKREQDEWVAKIHQMVVNGTTLATELRGNNELQREEDFQHTLKSNADELHLPQWDDSSISQTTVHDLDLIDDDTCCVFGANFHLMQRLEDISKTNCCFESDTEDEDDDFFLLQAQ